MNVGAYARMHHKIKDSPRRVVLEDYVSGETLADVKRSFDDALAPFSEYEVVGSRWFDENKDAVVLLVRGAV